MCAGRVRVKGFVGKLDKPALLYVYSVRWHVGYACPAVCVHGFVSMLDKPALLYVYRVMLARWIRLPCCMCTGFCWHAGYACPAVRVQDYVSTLDTPELLYVYRVLLARWIHLLCCMCGISASCSPGTAVCCKTFAWLCWS